MNDVILIDRLGMPIDNEEKRSKDKKKNIHSSSPFCLGRVFFSEFTRNFLVPFQFCVLCVLIIMSKRRIEVLDPFIKKKRLVHIFLSH